MSDATPQSQLPEFIQEFIDAITGDTIPQSEPVGILSKETLEEFADMAKDTLSVPLDELNDHFMEMRNSIRRGYRAEVNRAITPGWKERFWFRLALLLPKTLVGWVVLRAWLFADALSMADYFLSQDQVLNSPSIEEIYNRWIAQQPFEDVEAQHSMMATRAPAPPSQ